MSKKNKKSILKKSLEIKINIDLNISYLIIALIVIIFKVKGAGYRPPLASYSLKIWKKHIILSSDCLILILKSILISVYLLGFHLVY